jgi:hypothetical protein
MGSFPRLGPINRRRNLKAWLKKFKRCSGRIVDQIKGPLMIDLER